MKITDNKILKKMTWFADIVSKINEAYIAPDGFDKVKYIPRNETAFIPGDTVFYLRSGAQKITGSNTGYFYGVVDSVKDGLVYFKEKNPDGSLSDKLRKSAFDNKNLYYCMAWRKPVEDSGAWKMGPSAYKVSYEKSNSLKLYSRKGGNKQVAPVEDGKLFVVVHTITLGYKDYYDYETGAYVGTVDVQKMNISKTVWGCKKGSAEPTTIKIDNYNKSMYGVIPEEFQQSAVLKIGGKTCWNFKHVLGIGYLCPWLKDMDAPWSEPGADSVKVCNPFEFPEVRAKMEELGI